MTPDRQMEIRQRTPGTVWESTPRAKKDIRCTSCNRLILRGSVYRRWTGRSDAWNGLMTAKECVSCCERYGRPVDA